MNTIVLFLFAGSRRTSALLADMEAMYDDTDSWNILGRVSVRQRVLELLKFWREFYSMRAVEALSLELSSSIAFDDWLRGISSIEVAANELT
jgi:hypothetical protein